MGAKAIYLALVEADRAETEEAHQHLLPMLRLAAKEYPEGREFVRAVERMLEVTSQHGFPNFYAAFLHDGTLHRIHVCDRGAWPGVQEFKERAEAGDDEEDDDEDLEWVDEAIEDTDEPAPPAPPKMGAGRRGKGAGASR